MNAVDTLAKILTSALEPYPYGDDHLVRLTLMPDLKGVL